MFFSDEETEAAIDIIHMVKAAADENMPLSRPEDVARWEKDAEAGDEEAYKKLMCAKLHMIFPVIPEDSGTSATDRLWQSIASGRLEGILVVNSLDYEKAYEDYEWPPRLGSYIERWISVAVKSELTRAIADGWSGHRS